MRRKLLVIAMVTTMVASTLLVGCGGSDTSEATTKASVEQNNNNDNKVEDSTKDTSKKEDTTSKKEEVKGYDEVFYDEPDWDVEYADESDYFKENELPELKIEYAVMKYVFEDITQKFKNKEEVRANAINLISVDDSEVTTSFVCDVTKIVSEEDNAGRYTKFVGFNVSKTEAQDNLERKGYVVVELNANPIEEGTRSPMWISVFVTINEDGTYNYDEINIQYMLSH